MSSAGSAARVEKPCIRTMASRRQTATASWTPSEACNVRHTSRLSMRSRIDASRCSRLPRRVLAAAPPPDSTWLVDATTFAGSLSGTDMARTRASASKTSPGSTELTYRNLARFTPQFNASAIDRVGALSTSIKRASRALR